MRPLPNADLLAVLDLVQQLNAEGGCGPNGEPSAAVLAGIGRLIGADVTSYTKVDHRTNRLVGAAVELYVDFYQSRGTLDQLLCMASLDQRHGTTLALNRSPRGFSERDRRCWTCSPRTWCRPRPGPSG